MIHSLLSDEERGINSPGALLLLCPAIVKEYITDDRRVKRKSSPYSSSFAD
jgi:hypothetical protein